MKDNKKNRKEVLMKKIDNDEGYIPLVDEIVYLENTLKELRELPKIRVNSKNKMLQKRTDASKLYKEYLQQYLNAFKLLQKKVDGDASEDDLFKWLKDNNEWNERK